jgi:molecular chaperone GrpE
MMNRLVIRSLPRHAARASTRAVLARSQLSTPTVASSIQYGDALNFSARYFSDTGKKEEAAKEGEESPADETEAAATDEKPAVEEESREAKLQKEVKDLKDQLLRSLAEQQNTRRIAKEDVERARSFAIKSFAKSLLDTSDNLNLALNAVPEELRADAENHPVLVTLYEGIQMTETGLNKAFTMNGLLRYGEVGEVFDPNKHEALYEYPDPSQTPGTVGQIMKTGFMLNQRVLRPAEVGVVKKE